MQTDYGLRKLRAPAATCAASIVGAQSLPTVRNPSRRNAAPHDHRPPLRTGRRPCAPPQVPCGVRPDECGSSRSSAAGCRRVRCRPDEHGSGANSVRRGGPDSGRPGSLRVERTDAQRIHLNRLRQGRRALVQVPVRRQGRERGPRSRWGDRSRRPASVYCDLGRQGAMRVVGPSLRARRSERDRRAVKAWTSRRKLWRGHRWRRVAGYIVHL